MDWREYIQQAEPQPDPAPRLQDLLRAMQERPGATCTDAELAEPRLADEKRQVERVYKYAQRVLHRRVSEMSFEEYQTLLTLKALAR